MDDYLKQNYIRNTRQSSQVIDFKHLNLGGAKMPTNVDAAIECAGKVFIHIEAKYKTDQLPKGQELYYTRLTDTIQAGGAKSLLLVVTHETPVSEVLDIGLEPVTRIYMHHRWRKLKIPVKCNKITNWYIQKALRNDWRQENYRIH
jgi:hypothetical protein